VRERSRDKGVLRLEYEAFEEMTGAEMARIFADCQAGFGAPQAPGLRLRMLCVHRVGAVGVGQPSVVIAVASPHRDAAFGAARFLIDELKSRLPIWKKELYADGHHWVGERS
jgi:molybdopterin synthase catalytic subunit